MSELSVAQHSIFGDLEQGESLLAAYEAAKKARRSVKAKVTLPRKGAFIRHDLADPFADPAEQLNMFDYVPESQDAVDWGPNEPWTLDATFDFVDMYLKRSLKNLFDKRVSLAQKQSIWAWIMEPMAPYQRQPLPFSFQACCLMQNKDPESMQDALIWETRNEKFRLSHH